MNPPNVAIVGRPNVGKSSLFNRLIGRRVAIVDPTAGVTRDRILHPVERNELRFDLLDTGGIGLTDNAKLEGDITAQVMHAIEHADLVLWLVDARAGILPLDAEIAGLLRPHADRVLLVANKADRPALDHACAEFFALGLGEPLAVSVEHGRGLDLLTDRIRARLGPIPAGAPEPDGVRLRICLAGRRNVGKSRLTNAICGEDRVIVADAPGTTRDAIDITFDHPEEGPFLLIDTAGLRKKRQLTQDLEFYAACRTEKAILRCEVVLLVLDATDELGMVDKKLAHFCEASGKPTVIVINKWDLAQAAGAAPAAYEEWLRDRLPGLRQAPVVLTSALEGWNLTAPLRTARELAAETRVRVATSELNRILELAVARRRPRATRHAATRIYYATQAATVPPTFVVFVNRTSGIEAGYNRYLENFLRQHTPLKHVPIRIFFKARNSRFHAQFDAMPRSSRLEKASARPQLILPRRRKGPRGRRGR